MCVPTTDGLLEADVLQVRGTAVPAVRAPGAQQVGQAGAGVVLAFPEEGDLGKEEKKEDSFTMREVGLLAGASGRPSPGRCLLSSQHNSNSYHRGGKLRHDG